MQKGETDRASKETYYMSKETFNMSKETLLYTRDSERVRERKSERGSASHCEEGRAEGGRERWIYICTLHMFYKIKYITNIL